jgi:hypothetical protein
MIGNFLIIDLIAATTNAFTGGQPLALGGTGAAAPRDETEKQAGATATTPLATELP